MRLASWAASVGVLDWSLSFCKYDLIRASSTIPLFRTRSRNSYAVAGAGLGQLSGRATARPGVTGAANYTSIRVNSLILARLEDKRSAPPNGRNVTGIIERTVRYA